MKIATVVGARPQFIKAAVVSHALRAAGVKEVLVHTGQHYDAGMSDVFFRELDIAEPDCRLSVGSGSHGEQTGQMLVALERVLKEVRPDRVLVYGDTNSTLAGALAAAKLAIPIDHVEAGLRSFDRDMPEEINRVLTDRVSDQLFCPTRTAVENLAREGLTRGVQLTGDVMLDLAICMRGAALATSLPVGLHERGYFVATVHRASNTDDRVQLAKVINALADISARIAPVVLPVHPRLAARLTNDGLSADVIRCIEPVGYVEMHGLILRARGVITDSGGVQKEALFHGVPCLTLRETTEWMESVDCGLNVLVGQNLSALTELASACDGQTDVPTGILEAFGGGRAGLCIADAMRGVGRTRRRWFE